MLKHITKGSKGKLVEIMRDKSPNVKNIEDAHLLYKLAFIDRYHITYRKEWLEGDITEAKAFCLRYDDEEGVKLDVHRLLEMGSDPVIIREMIIYEKMKLDKSWCVALDIHAIDEFHRLRECLKRHKYGFDYDQYDEEDFMKLREDMKTIELDPQLYNNTHSLKAECRTFDNNTEHGFMDSILEDLDERYLECQSPNPLTPEEEEDVVSYLYMSGLVLDEL